MKVQVIIPDQLSLRIVILSNSLTNKILFQAYIFALSKDKYWHKEKNQFTSAEESIYGQKPDDGDIKKEKC